MNFFTMQSLGKYTKNMEMQLKWQQKKKNNNFTADGSTKLNDPVARQAEEIRLAQADQSSKLSSQIGTKLATGKKLTQEEMDYLQKNDPQTYQKAKEIEAEKKGYEKELEDCKTKEDVERVKMNRTAAALSVVNSVENNSAIPESAKLGLIWQELQKNMAMDDAIQKFIESGRYAQLPTEAEKMEAEKALKEAREAELGIDESAKNTEEKDSVENTDEKGSIENIDREDLVKNGNDTEADRIKEEIPSDKSKQAAVHETVQKSQTALQEHRITRAEAETTPEALKVKRARVQAAYKKNQIDIPAQIMDLKAE